MADKAPLTFDPRPRYPAVGGALVSGWTECVATLPTAPLVLALDGPMVLDWEALVTGLTEAIEGRGIPVESLDLRTRTAAWGVIVERTGSDQLCDDPHFDRLPTGTLADLFDEIPALPVPEEGIHLVFGPGAALVRHDVLWYADLPKRYAEEAVTSGRGRNLGQPDGPFEGEHLVATTKRLLYIDWPLLDRHRDTVAGGIDRWIDLQDPALPVSMDGDTLRRTIVRLAGQPFRTRPTFNSTSWGGHWAQRELGMNTEARNTALGYALIAPESGVLVGAAGAEVEVPFQLIVSRHPELVMGAEVHATFGTSFPIRFDYLDTVGGGSLSVHLHPQTDYMREVFGWPYPQHETYYVMVGGEQHKIYLGLREDVDVDEFRRQAHAARHHEHPFDIEKHVQTFPAAPHQLFMIPAGTPHGSGEGNVVLEVSATPYLYSLRFYDWLRRDADDNQRPVHVEHAFTNLGSDRIGARIGSDLVQTPTQLRVGKDCNEELLGSLPDVFFEVRRLTVHGGADLPDDTTGRHFHILNVVEGAGVLIETTDGIRHSLAYAETIVIPAAVGAYSVRNAGPGPVRLVKALVR
jgi:mannose-6-phosphate isomerase class I